MYKIGIIGHSPEHFAGDVDKTRRTVENAIGLLGYQYGKDNVLFNLAGDIGIGIWSAKIAIKNDYRVHLFLPYPLEETYIHWYESQKQDLIDCYKKAHAITTCCGGSSLDFPDTSYTHIVDMSSFTIAYWIGKKQGKTYEAIKYALKENKLILDGFNELELITNANIKK